MPILVSLYVSFFAVRRIRKNPGASMATRECSTLFTRRKITVSFNEPLVESDEEFNRIQTWLRWMCIDQSTLGHTISSWSLFILLAIVIPCLSHFVLACPKCDSVHKRPFDSVVQLALSIVALLSFLCFSGYYRRYGLKKFLLLDKLYLESEMVRRQYKAHFKETLKLLFILMFPSFMLESAYKIWWYASGASRIPFLGNPYASDAVACFFELCSWLYRTSIFFHLCVLFRLFCHLQILRIQDFAHVFQRESEVGSVLREHLKIRRQLRIISHRFRVFIVSALLLVTATLLASLLVTTRSHSADANVFKAGELALCCMSLVVGLLMCLRSAAKITHKTQAITAHAARWHVCATIESFEGTDCETPTPAAPSYARIFPIESIPASSDDEDEIGEEDDLNAQAALTLPYVHTISFQKREALVTYFEHNRTGITIFGMTLDRVWLHTIFGIELSLVLWLLSKTIGIK